MSAFTVDEDSERLEMNNCCMERAVQCKVLTRKNIILSFKRNWAQTVLQLMAPTVCLFALFFIQLAVNNSIKAVEQHPPDLAVPGLEKCIPMDKDNPCVTLIYMPNTNPDVNTVMQYFADNNKPSLSYDDGGEGWGDHDLDMWGAETYDEVFDFVIENPNITYAVVNFLPPSFDNETVSAYYWDNWAAYRNDNFDTKQVYYEVWFNSSLKQPVDTCGDFANYGLEFRSNEAIMAIQRGVDESLLTFFSQAEGGDEIELNAESRAFVELLDVGAPEELATAVGGVFFTGALMINFIISTVTIVSEKELKLRSGMRMMGLKDSVFWLTWLLRESSIIFVSTLILIMFGHILGFVFFTRCNFFVSFFLFFSFGMVMAVVGFWITTLVSRVVNSLVVAIPIIILSVFLALLYPVLYFLFSDTVHIGYRYIFNFIPAYHFILFYQGVAPKTYSTYDYSTGELEDGPGFHWRDMYRKPYQFRGIGSFHVPTPNEHLLALWALFALFSFLTWYFDGVVPSESGAARPWYFPFMPSYWGCASPEARFKNESIEVYDSYTNLAGETINVDSDVKKEMSRVKKGNYGKEAGLVVRGLQKWYGGGRVKAVNGISFAADYGKVFALLGHNGAGKTTAIGVMTGLLHATDGDVEVFGKSVTSDVDGVRRMLGVCPQHDILWSDLTAAEHLELFAEFKGIKSEAIPELVRTSLEAVKLDAVADKKAGEFSGGMKRRLSVANAFIGQPRFVCLDEPTTGMDPVNRAHVWRMVERLKHDKIILLTTHSMEEADTLGDNIAIMNEGRMACIGTSLHLKHRFGAGYHLTVISDDTKVDDVIAKISKLIPGCKLSDRVAGSLNFELPQSTKDLPKAFKWIEDHATGKMPLIRDFGISQTTLEEVFLRLTHQHTDVAELRRTQSIIGGADSVAMGKQPSAADDSYSSYSTDDDDEGGAGVGGGSGGSGGDNNNNNDDDDDESESPPPEEGDGDDDGYTEPGSGSGSGSGSGVDDDVMM